MEDEGISQGQALEVVTWIDGGQIAITTILIVEGGEDTCAVLFRAIKANQGSMKGSVGNREPEVGSPSRHLAGAFVHVSGDATPAEFLQNVRF